MSPELIAKRTRRIVEKWARESVVPHINPRDLCCACGIASFALWKSLRAVGHKADLLLADGDWCSHCWVEHKGYAYDVTATQFDFSLPGVYIAETRKYRSWLDSKIHIDGPVLKNKRAVDDLKTWPERPQLVASRINSFVSRIKAKHG